eukprot:7801622-Karenia_brevis.AAC.1
MLRPGVTEHQIDAETWSHKLVQIDAETRSQWAQKDTETRKPLGTRLMLRPGRLRVPHPSGGGTDRSARPPSTEPHRHTASHHHRM